MENVVDQQTAYGLMRVRTTPCGRPAAGIRACWRGGGVVHWVSPEHV